MGEGERQELTIKDIFSRYAGRWVAVIVTRRDQNLQPLAGIVVEDDIDRYRLRERTSKYNELCIFYAGDTEYPLML